MHGLVIKKNKCWHMQAWIMVVNRQLDPVGSTRDCVQHVRMRLIIVVFTKITSHECMRGLYIYGPKPPKPGASRSIRTIDTIT